MQAEYYKTGIAVFGDTLTWRENLYQLGGIFNKNLGGRIGWFFKKESEPVLMQFIANANAGAIQPLPSTKGQRGQQQVTATPQMVPFGQVQQAMSPQDAMVRLTLNATQPQKTPQDAMEHFLQPVTLPGTTFTPQQALTLLNGGRPNIPQPRPLVPAPVAVGITTPTTVNYPNTFIAADGVTYQIVMQTVPLPHVGQTIIFRDDGNVDVQLVITKVVSFDHIRVSRVDRTNVQDDDVLEDAHVIVIDGKWRIASANFLDVQHHYTLTFLPKQ